MAQVFEIDIDGSTMQASGHQNQQNGSDDENEVEISEDFSRGPDIQALNASMMKDPSMEALELSERTVPGKGGKAGPQGEINRYTRSIDQSDLCAVRLRARVSQPGLPWTSEHLVMATTTTRTTWLHTYVIADTIILSSRAVVSDSSCF